MRAIGIFDSGFGGLTVFKSIAGLMPEYDYVYLGDNARAPYGNRSFETVYQYTLQAVNWFFSQGCPLVLIACNTASAKALRNIQQKNIPKTGQPKKVLGVIRPTAEVIGNYSKTNNVGILGTNGTVNSGSYLKEIQQFFPEVNVFQQACPLWVPFIENGDYQGTGVDYFIQKDICSLFDQCPPIDTILLACTHYPLLEDKIKKFIPDDVKLVSQGPIVAESLKNYLDRHPEIDVQISRNRQKKFFTTDAVADFEGHATAFFGAEVKAESLVL